MWDKEIGERALEDNAKAGNSQVRWPTEPEDRAILAMIMKLLKQALMAGSVWEAMEYLMAARGLIRMPLKEGGT